MQSDEFSGQGGSYMIDPATGQRVLLERTEEAKPADENEAAPVAAQE